MAKAENRTFESTLFGKDILSADQFSAEDLALIVALSTQMRETVKTYGGIDLLPWKLMAPLFYEDSSRTKGSFEAAMLRLGGNTLAFTRQFSSVTKGENLADTVRTFEAYADVIVLRHPEVGSARSAAQVLEIPLINAGDGIGEHPTQAALDLFTIQDHFPNLDGISVTLIGDLLNGRTVHSLSRLLSLYPGVTLNLVSPEILRFPSTLLRELRDKGMDIREYETLDAVLNSSDVLYVTRVQKERFTDLDLYESLKHHYVITPQTMTELPEQSILMHPLPRVGEIHDDVDYDPRALYLREQVPNGMYVRMALLALVLKQEVTL